MRFRKTVSAHRDALFAITAMKTIDDAWLAQPHIGPPLRWGTSMPIFHFGSAVGIEVSLRDPRYAIAFIDGARTPEQAWELADTIARLGQSDIDQAALVRTDLVIAPFSLRGADGSTLRVWRAGVGSARLYPEGIAKILWMADPKLPPMKLELGRPFFVAVIDHNTSVVMLGYVAHPGSAATHGPLPGR